MTNYDVAVFGASLGGLRAAISAAKHNKKVLLTEETDWIGGQLTSQAVPPDEHRWIESQGSTLSYREYRNKVRDFYRSKQSISDEIKGKDFFCPGSSWVSRISHEPLVALTILNNEIKPYLEKGLITLKYFTVADTATIDSEYIKNVTIKNINTGETETVTAHFYLDGTDCGDLLPIVKADFSLGAESKNMTGEYHATEKAHPEDMQPITWVFALELVDKLSSEDIIEKPELYEYFTDIVVPYDDNKLISWYGLNAHTNKKHRYGMFNNDIEKGSLGLWEYRRIVSKENYKEKVNEISLINWPQNDYYLGNIYNDKDYKLHRFLSRQQSLCLAYYLQNEAPNKEGGKGYPVRLCGEAVGTKDGLAKAPYIRESRRIIAKHTIVEEDVSKRNNKGINILSDSVGVGHYAIDIHMTTKTHSYMYDATYPFEIPLSAMIPINKKNLIPACKNIGATHLTNGCYRLHPVEWNVGEVAGLLATFCIENKCTPEEVLESNLDKFQNLLVNEGVQLHWDEKEMN
jgi:hypothetical protein